MGKVGLVGSESNGSSVGDNPEAILLRPQSHIFGNFELLAAQRTLHRRIPALIRFEGLACEERLGGCTQPDCDRLRSWIGTAEHAISKITRPPQTGFHSGRRFDAAFRRFNRGQDYLARRLPAEPFPHSLHEWIERIQHGPISWLRATQF